MRVLSWTPLVALPLWLAPHSALANPSVEQCIGQHEDGQRAEKQRRLVQARDAFESCRQSTCPKVVREDCAARATRLTDRLPTLRIRVSGATSESVVVYLDGRELGKLLSDPLPVDPGLRVVRVVTSTGRSESREVQVDEGDGVPVEFDFREAAVDPTPEPSPASVPVGAYVAGGVAVVALAGFVGFGLAGRSKERELESCKGGCTDRSLYQDMKSDFVRADISLGVALVATAVGLYLVLDSPSRKPSTTTGSAPRRWLSTRSLEHGALMQFGGTF